jgi:hypothetical protein
MMGTSRNAKREGKIMGFFDEPIRAEVAGTRRRVLHLLRNHHPSRGTPADLVELADTYLRLNPDDTEVRAIRDRLATLA